MGMKKKKAEDNLLEFLLSFLKLDDMGKMGILIMLNIPVEIDKKTGKIIDVDTVVGRMREVFFNMPKHRQEKILEIMKEAIEDEPSAESNKDKESRK